MDDIQINLTLTVAQINVILGVLGEAPFRVAQPLIQSVQEQAQPQLQAAQAQQALEMPTEAEDGQVEESAE
jgi:hypothetical protein